jgi:hypothetical protein
MNAHPHDQDGQVGTVYVLHFEPAYRHARHYLGWARDVDARVAEHLAGSASPLVRAAVLAGATGHARRALPGVTTARTAPEALAQDRTVLSDVPRPARRRPETPTTGAAMTRPAISRAAAERLADGMVWKRLATGPRVPAAENARAQAAREEEIERAVWRHIEDRYDVQ